MLKSRVQTKQGILQGTIEESDRGVQYVSFKGIPFAKPPLGNLRFADPQSPEPWDGVRDASKHGDVCFQKGFITNVIEGSEDCLYLNVYTPNVEGETRSKKYPTMVFIHGGAFKSGSGNSDVYGPEYIINQGVILVTINYRLEAFGFLCLDTEEVPGNAGLKDQVMAMRWVKDNISNFGGDSNNVTIFGESAGSLSVTFHLFSPLTKGLFQAAIAQSGACTANFALDNDAVNRAFRLGKSFGKNTTDKRELLEFLRSVPSRDLVDVTSQTRNEIEIVNRHLGMLFVPVIEKENILGMTYLSTPINNLLSNGQFHDVSIIFGFNSGEGIISVNEALKQKDQINKDFGKFLSGILRMNVSKEVIENFKQFYFEDRIFDENTLLNMVNLRTEAYFSYSIYHLAKKISARAKFPIFFYVFGCLSELNILTDLFKSTHLNLTCHFDELFYLFKSPAFCGDLKIDDSTQTGMMVARAVALWTNFAKCGNPTPRLNDLITTKWEPISGEDFNYLEISEFMKLKKNPIKERIDFWDKMLKL